MTQYGLIVALVALVLVTALSHVGSGLEHVFCKVDAGLHPHATTLCTQQVKP